MRGEASPPRNDPSKLVGGVTVSVMSPTPTVGLVLLRSGTGRSKLGWLRRLKACAPTVSLALSHLGKLKLLEIARSVLKYRGPRKVLRPWLPKPVGLLVEGENSAAFQHRPRNEERRVGSEC